MDVIEHKSASERRGNRAEPFNNEINIVQRIMADSAAVGTQLRCYREPAGERAGAKATRQQLFDDIRGSFGIAGVEQGGEHGQ